MDILKKIEEAREDYRSIPFWSWNNLLSDPVSAEQIDAMKQAGAGGFFMHCRAGLKTPYLSDEFFDRVRFCVDKSVESGLSAWAYDEFGWPSGFADGKVPSMGYDYQQKSLRFTTYETGMTLPERLLGVYRPEGDGYRRVETPAPGDRLVSVDVNLYYIDPLNRASTAAFIRFTHEEYAKRFGEKFGKELKGFFTDEPQYANGGIPWSESLIDAFREDYGQDIRDGLCLLDEEWEGYETFRYRYYLTAARLFQENFMRQIYDWCEAHGCQLTGHMMSEDDLVSQMRCTGGVMPCYQYFHIPGMDWLCRGIAGPTIPKQVSSACAQLGKPRSISEMFALCGWDVSLDELKWIGHWHYVNGINLTCQHLEGYSLEGFRKRDYPPSVFIQESWFERYNYYNDYISRLGAALSMGEEETGLLLVHPMRSAYILYKSSSYDALWPLSDLFRDLTEKLSYMQLDHHYGDETLMEKYGRVEKGRLVIGRCAYDRVLLPDLRTVSASTLSLLLEFGRQGGKLYYIGSLPAYLDGVKDPAVEELARYARRLENTDQGLETLRPAGSFRIRFLEGTAAPVDGDAISPLPAGQPRGLSSGGGDHRVSSRVRVLPDGGRMVFIANLSRETTSRIKALLPGSYALTALDLATGKSAPLSAWMEGTDTAAVYTLSPMEALLVYAAPGQPERVDPPAAENLHLSSRWHIASRDKNALTLDTCRYRVDGGPWQGPQNILLIQQDLLGQKRPCHLELEYAFSVDDPAAVSGLELVTETPDKYSITLNGRPVDWKDAGFYTDRAFRRTPIDGYVQKGKNVIRMETEFYQRQKVYDVLFGENVHETERNKLTYDTELEAVYIIGDFSVKNQASYTYGERKAIFTGYDFSLAAPVDAVESDVITESGYWFFRGEMTLEQTVRLEKAPDMRYRVTFDKVEFPAGVLYVNGKEAAMIGFSPFTYDVTDLLQEGENRIAIKLYAGNRNLLGPHHRVEGENYDVGPHTFLDRSRWYDGFAFVRFGFTTK